MCGTGAGSELAEADAEDERLHIFTVASGHMYERLQKIMILSVIRNTKCVNDPVATEPKRVHTTWLSLGPFAGHADSMNLLVANLDC